MTNFKFIAGFIVFVLLASCQKDKHSRLTKSWEVCYNSTHPYPSFLGISGQNDAIYVIADLSGDRADGFSQAILRTHDGGDTWQREGLNLHLDKLVYLQPLDNGRLIASKTNDSLVVSDDHGKTWNKLSEERIPSVRQFLFPYNNQTGFIVAIDRIYSTENEGTDWQVIFNEFDIKVKKLLIPDRTVFYAFGGYTGSAVNYGQIIKSTDAGATWSLLESDFTNIADAFFIDRERGYVFTNDQKLHKTTNGGKSWAVVNNQTGISNPRCYFVSEMKGYMVDVDDGLFATVNGGKTWKKEIDFPSTWTSFGRNGLFQKNGSNIYLMLHDLVLRITTQ